jgi:solute carrier family 25 citrate transporter 1
MSKTNNKAKVAPSTHLIAGGIAGFAEACTCHRAYCGMLGAS